MTDAPLGAVTPIETEALNDWLDAVEAGGWVREYLVNGIESTIRAERTKANAARAEAADEVAAFRERVLDAIGNTTLFDADARTMGDAADSFRTRAMARVAALAAEPKEDA